MRSGARVLVPAAAPNSLHEFDPANAQSGSARARVVAVTRRLKLSPRAAAVPRVPVPESLPYAPPAPARLPIGGATAGSGGSASPAPHVVAMFEVLALALVTLVLWRRPLDVAPWRSTLWASRPERPD